jgi:hypothetical protein
MVVHQTSLTPPPVLWGHLHSLAQATAEGTIDGFFSRKAAFMRLPATLPGGQPAVVLAHHGGITITTKEKQQDLQPFISTLPNRKPAETPPLPSLPLSRSIALGPASPSTPNDVWIIASYAEDVVGVLSSPENADKSRAWLARLIPTEAVFSLENAFPMANIPVGHLFRNALALGRDGSLPVRRRIYHLVGMAALCALIVLFSFLGWLPFWCASLSLLTALFIARFHAALWPIPSDHLKQS